HRDPALSGGLGAEPPSGLCRERGPAAAGALDVRVAELEAGAVEALYVVDLGPVEVLVAERVDVELDALVLERLVELGRLVLEVEVVGEAGAPSADDAQAQPLAREVLGGGDFQDLLGRLLRDRDHPPASSTSAPRRCPSGRR